MLRTGIIVVVAFLGTFVLLHALIQRHFEPTPLELENAKRARSNSPRPAALDAVDRFTQLPMHEQRELTANLRSALLAMDAWFEQLSNAHYQMLCLGEDHEPSTRAFLAREFFAKFYVDVLLLETTARDLQGMNQAVAGGDAYVPLLEADIAGILTATRASNPQVLVAGIEETKRQRAERQKQGRSSFRDDSIVSNFWRQFQPGKRHAVLFGALHCTDNPKWLFDRVQHTAPPLIGNKMLNVRIIGEHQDESVEDFVYFLDQIGFDRRHFVIADSGALHPYIYQWFWLLPSTLRPYQAVVVFRN